MINRSSHFACPAGGVVSRVMRICVTKEGHTVLVRSLRGDLPLPRGTRTRSGHDHEQGAIRAFVLRDKQKRFLTFLANPENRKKLTTSLAHFRCFDQRFATSVLWKVDSSLKLWERHIQGIETIYHLLKSRGAGLTCWVISEDADRDGRELDLRTYRERS